MSTLHIWIFSWEEGCPSRACSRAHVPPWQLEKYSGFPYLWAFALAAFSAQITASPPPPGPFSVSPSQSPSLTLFCGCSAPPPYLSISARSPRAHHWKLLSPVHMSLPITVWVPQEQGLVLKPSLGQELVLVPVLKPCSGWGAHAQQLWVQVFNPSCTLGRCQGCRDRARTRQWYDKN